MTQDVQPLTWQKRTNLEEHQQFFSKINEIIANLAPTVDEAEQAIAQATQAIASANQAIATANAASAAADAAAQQAQTAANTVAGYNTRLIAVEDEAAGSTANIIDLQDRMGTAEGNITSLTGRMTSAESKNNQQDTTIAALLAADAQNVKISRINEYAVGLTGNQNKTGVLGFFTAPKNASLYDRLSTVGDWIIGKIPAPSQTIVINAIVASREFNGIQLWIISVFTDGRITVTDQLGGTPPTIKHMVKDDEHYLAVTTVGNNVHYSIKWFMCRMGGTITYMETTALPVQADSSYVDVNA